MRNTGCTTCLGLAAFAALGLLASRSLGVRDFDGDGDVDLADYAEFFVCLNGPGQPPGTDCTIDADFHHDGDVDLVDFASFQASFTSSGVPPALPSKSIGFDLIDLHDPDSDRYNGDCVGCHGNMTNEVALDGITPTAHSRMLLLFGEGNDRCTACHQSATNFLTYSAANLRKQVSLEDRGCTVCHGRFGTPPFYVR